MVYAEQSSKPSEDIVSLGTVLLVEDEAEVQNIFRIILTSLGYTVVCAKNGEEGLIYALSHAESIKLIITDVQMPKMKGDEMVRKLREKIPHVKVIFTSGIQRKDGWDDGITWFAQKPIGKAQLKDLLSQVPN